MWLRTEKPVFIKQESTKATTKVSAVSCRCVCIGERCTYSARIPLRSTEECLSKKILHISLMSYDIINLLIFRSHNNSN